MTTKVIKRSIMYSILIIIMFSIMVALGIYRLYNGDVVTGLLIAFLFIILAVMAFLNGAMDNSPRIRIDEEGITAKDLGEGKILWIDIKNARLVSVPRSGYVITIELYNPSKYSAQINNLFRLQSFTIRTNGLDIPPKEIYNEIMRYINNNISV